jgi:O-antigen/teichoic acid export membrane protein
MNLVSDDADEPSQVSSPAGESKAIDDMNAAPLAGPQSATLPFPKQLANARNRLRKLVSILRITPFETITAEGRSNERYRRAALTTVTSMIARVLGIFTGLAWIRLSISYLGKEQYGLWMAVGSLAAWANLADLGLARGMQNHLSEANGKDDRELASRYVSTGLVALSAVAILFAILATPAVLFLPWASLLNVKDPALFGETRSVVAAVLACFLLQFPLSVVPTIYAAYQRGYVAAIFNILGSLLSLASLVAVTRAHVSLPWLIVLTSGTGIVMSLVNLGFVLREMPWLRPRLRLATTVTLRALASTSVALFVFQVGALLINETQSFVIARRLGLVRVAEWSVFMRVHLLPYILIQMIDSPLIPAFRESHVRGEHQWLRTAFWRITKLKLAIAVVCAVLLVTAGNFATVLIGGHDIKFSWNMWAASGFLLLVAVWNGSFNDLMIATDRLRLLVITVLINGFVTIGLSYTMAPHLGLVGVVLATAAFSLVVSAWLLPWACKDLLAKRPDSVT